MYVDTIGSRLQCMYDDTVVGRLQYMYVCMYIYVFIFVEDTINSSR